MEEASTFEQLVVQPIQEMLTTLAGFIPVLIGALAILIIGWLVAKVIRNLTHKLLEVIKFETLAQKAGINEILQKGGITITASEMLARLVYWLVMIIVLVMTVNAIGLTVASQLLDRFTQFIPRVISAVFVLIVGMFLANVISGIVTTAASNTKVPKPDLLGNLARWSILIFAIVIALGEIGVATLLVSTTFNIFFGAVCLALALAFGLGGKDAAAKVLRDYMEK